MVNPISPDKSMTMQAERSMQPEQREEMQEMSRQPSGASAQEQSRTQVRVDVENARQLYEMENQRMVNPSSSVSNPQQARALVTQILEQFSANPQQAMQGQANASANALVNRMERAPA